MDRSTLESQPAASARDPHQPRRQLPGRPTMDRSTLESQPAASARDSPPIEYAASMHAHKDQSPRSESPNRRQHGPRTNQPNQQRPLLTRRVRIWNPNPQRQQGIPTNRVRSIMHVDKRSVTAGIPTRSVSKGSPTIESAASSQVENGSVTAGSSLDDASLTEYQPPCRPTGSNQWKSNRGRV